jgi:hypothetical protein
MADCFKIINQISAGRLSDDELNDILERLNEEKRVRQARGQLEDLESQLFERGVLMARDADLARRIEKRNRLRNIIVENRLMELSERADQATDNPSLGVEAALVGVNAPFEGAGRSIDALTNAIMRGYSGGFIADLNSANLMRTFNTMSEDMERQVSRVLADLNLPEPTRAVEASADAKRIAEIMFKYQRAALQRENRAGSYIQLKAGRVVRSSHNPAQMTKVGREEWKNYIRNRLNYDRMDVRSDRIEDFLNSAYTAIVSGVRLNDEITPEIARAFKGPANLAKKRSAQGVFTFNNADDWYEYNQRFGVNSLREAYLQDLQASARSSAIMEVMGTNPQAMLDKVLNRLRQKYRDDATKLAQINREGWSGIVSLQAALDEVTGDVNIGASDTIARWMHGFRALQTMSKLGGAAISATTDLAFVASARIYQGRSLLDAWGDAFSAVFRGLNSGEQRELADRLGVGIEGQLGDFMSRFDAQDDIPGATSKLMQLFFRLNLLQPWTEANKRGVSLMIANDLGREAGKSFADLPEDMRRILRIYEVDEEQWNVARASVKNGPDGRAYIVPGEIADDRVRESIFALIMTETDSAVPSPGARERSILRRGYRPGTFAGEAIRTLTQFKSFGITAVARNLGRHVYGYGAKSKREAFTSGRSIQGLANVIVGTTVLGYFAMQAKELVKGREPRPATPETLIAAMLQGGGLGIYGDFLFGEANRFGGGTLETIAGPGVSAMTDAIDLLQRTRGVVTGGDEDLSGDAIRLLKSNLPFANLFYTQQALDYLVWYQLQETLNPGYLRRMERRTERENDQTFWLRPSDVIATGGGFR